MDLNTVDYAPKTKKHNAFATLKSLKVNALHILLGFGMWPNTTTTTTEKKNQMPIARFNGYLKTTQYACNLINYNLSVECDFCHFGRSNHLMRSAN